MADDDDTIDPHERLHLPADGVPGGVDGFHHEPVCAELVVSILADAPPGIVVDATVGGGGHAERLLDARSDVTVVGIDRDPAAVEAATRRLARFGQRARVVHGRFDDMAQLVAAAAPNVPSNHPFEPLRPNEVSAVLFDLGVSSFQLDRAARGFSFRRSGPLDMRMDPTSGTTAADVLNTSSAEHLADIFDRYGDEPFARRVAQRLVDERPFDTTDELADSVARAIPRRVQRGRRHAATKVFQALRIEVNDELRLLPRALDEALALLAPGGRCVAMSYHSGEDRLVKSRFRTVATGGCVCPDGLPCQCGAVPTGHLLKRGAWKADAAEIERNPRARSVRVRAVEMTRAAS